MQKTGQKIPPAHCRPQGSAMGGIFWDRMFGCRAAGGGARKDRCGTVCTEIRCIPPSGAPPQPAKRPLRRSTAARSARRLRFIAVLKSGLLSAKLSRQTKTRGVPCRVAHSRHGIPLGSCLAKRPSLHFSRDVDARWAGAHVHTRQNAAFWLGWTYESVACPPVFIAFAPEMEA